MNLLPGPESADPAARDGFERWFVRIFLLLVLGGFVADVLVDYAPVRLSVVYFLASWVLLTVAHELGHAAMARAFGWQVTRFVIGIGGVWRSFRVASTEVELRLIPIGGFVVPLPPDARVRRLENALIYLAGPGIELALAGLVVLAIGPERFFVRDDSAWLIAAQSFCAAAAWGAATNLLPFRSANGTASDGLGALMSPFLTEKDFAARQVGPQLQSLRQHLEAGDAFGALTQAERLLDANPDVLALHFLIAEALLALHRREEALLRVQALLVQHPRQRPQIQALLTRIRAASR